MNRQKNKGLSFDIDALTSLVTEEKRSTGARNPSTHFLPQRSQPAVGEGQSATKSILTGPPVEYIPQEWAEKLYPQLNQNSEKECRKVYIGGLGGNTTDAEVKRFLTNELKEQSICPIENIIVNIEMRHDAERRYRFCFVEFLHEELSNMAMSLHEREFLNNDGKTTFIKVGRTKDYPGSVNAEKVVKLVRIDGIPKESIEKENLLSMFSDDEIGKVVNLWILRDHITLSPSGSVFVHYHSGESVEKLILALRGAEYEGATLHVREATQEDRFYVVKNKELAISDGLLYFLTCEDPPRAFSNGTLNEFTQNFDPALSFTPEPVISGSLILTQTTSSTEQLISDILMSSDGRGVENILHMHYKNRKLLPPTRVLVLLNMIEEAELEDDETFHNLKEDIEEELEQFGLLQELHITRFPPIAPVKPANPPPGVEKTTDPRWAEYEKQMNQFHKNLSHPVHGFVGRVFAVYSSVNDAMNAQKCTSGRRFNGRTIITSFISEKLLYPDANVVFPGLQSIENEKRLAIM